MSDWETLSRLLPFAIVLILLIRKRMRRTKTATKVRVGKSREPEFKRDYEPLEPS